MSLVTDGPSAANGALTLIGDGAQHWTWVHVDDLARLYLPAVGHPESLGRLIGSDGNPTSVRAIAESVARPAESVAGPAESVDAARARSGPRSPTPTSSTSERGAKARSLGWVPQHTSVLEEVQTARPAAAQFRSDRRPSRRRPRARRPGSASPDQRFA
ncbi:hypothetical protein [Agromyces bauzanensis]|uniref:hypothetical protein n=1 Tax=Agromyces bauzanensis TaxID=1308924 RepID=UPI0031E5EEC7